MIFGDALLGTGLFADGLSVPVIGDSFGTWRDVCPIDTAWPIIANNVSTWDPEPLTSTAWPIEAKAVSNWADDAKTTTDWDDVPRTPGSTIPCE